jgi:hypothetical protein
MNPNIDAASEQDQAVSPRKRKRWSAPRVILTQLRSAQGGSFGTSLTPDHKITGTSILGGAS